MRKGILGRVILTILTTATIFALLTGFNVVTASNSTVKTIWSSTSTLSASYARMLKLEHNGDNNGRLYTTFETWDSAAEGMNHGPTFPIYESVDNGCTWQKISEVSDAHSADGEGLREQGFLYELPQQIGDMPKGTVLLAVNCFPEVEYIHNIELYKSNDLCRTWTYVSTIAVGGAYGGGMIWESQGIWEPFLMVGNDKLICYYADEQDSSHNQMIVHRSSTDGIHWSDASIDVALGELRPGMPVVSKMGNGKYILVYEMYNMQDDQIHFKISDDPENWGDSSDYGQKVNYYRGEKPGSQPYVIWIDSGGPNGTLVLSSGGSNKLFLNYNYGLGHWVTQDCVIPAGYSRCLVPMGGAAVMAVSSVYNGITRKNDVQCGVMEIQSSGEDYCDAFFALVNKNGKAMDLIGGGTEDGAIINQFELDSNSINQQWSIVPAGNGRLRISSKVNGKNAAVQEGSLLNGAQIVCVPYAENDLSQQWEFQQVENGWMTIVNAKSGKCLDVDNDSLENGAKLQQWDCADVNCQKWTLKPVGEYYINAKHSGKYVNIDGGVFENGSPIIQYTFEPNTWFRWGFDLVEDGWMRIFSASESGKCIDESTVSLTGDAPLNLWDYVGGDNQKICLIPQDDGSFKMKFKHSGQIWSVLDCSRENEALLVQYSDENNDCQKFYLERVK